MCLLCIQNIAAQLSKKHFLPPLTYAENGNANPENQYLYISTPSSSNISYTIKQIGNPTNISGVVSSTSPQEIFIGTGDSQLFVAATTTSTIHNDKGFIIEADSPIYVSVRVLAGGNGSGDSPQAGALVSKGSSGLGKVFRAGMFTNENPQSNYLNFIAVMATENNTIVNFDNLPAGISLKNYTGSFPISPVLLNEGESYLLATNAEENAINRDGLIGTLITSDKPIVVNVGSANGSFHNGGGRDYGIDQIVGLDKIGSEYIFVKGDGENGWENVLLVAHENNTTVNINGNGVTNTINAGEYLLIEGNAFNTNGNMFVETSKPVFAYQGIGATTSEANQGLFFVPPLSCENRGKVDNIPTIESIGNVVFSGGVTIVTNTGAAVTVNSQPIANFNTLGPFSVDGNTNYVTYKITNLIGNISIESSEELYCAYFNQNNAASSGSFYSGFPSAPEINFNASVSTLGNCLPNVTLEAANTDLFDSFEWFFDAGSGAGFVPTGILTPTFKPTLPGNYQLKATINCTNSNFNSVIVPVSICPDDFDGDLIIDNLDIDLDNDGILNCEESIGDATLNFANTNTPSIIFNDGSTTNSIVTSNYTTTIASNSITGTNNGNFTSTITPGKDSKLNYKLNFTQPINFKFIQNETTDHSISEGEFFIIKIGPNNKNVTLLDPDDQLLIDTNFDDIYESGITQISSSEIKFKYKNNLNGADATFQFVANQVTQLDFKHQSSGLTTNSIFNGSLQLTCFSLDSDADGIENMFDLDSDNDGIPDIIEAFGQEITVSGIDSNLDGLDDVFSSNMNLDIDGDGVKNYIDLDSDNDGIFDTTEAGHNLDLNLDGIIDNANALIGSNGLVDTLETIPDAKILSLNYTIANTDNDLDFNFTEIDSDNDNCFDVNEAGFTDLNRDGILDTNPFAIDATGKLINNSDGYTNPNANYTIAAPIIITTPFTDVIFCESETNTISIATTADGFQWEVSTDNGTSFTTITNNAVYSGATTKELQISNTTLSYHNNQYRVLLTRTGNSCSFTSNEITLTVNPLPTIVPSPTLYHCIAAGTSNPTVNLTLAEGSISSTPNVTFLYFTDALATNQITDPTAYPVQPNLIQSVFVKVVTDQNCSRDVVELLINVGETPDNAYADLQPPVCDDFLDANGNNTLGSNSDTDGIANFNLDKNSIINSINPPPNTKVLFYESATDRNNTLNDIDITNYRNDLSKIDISTNANGIQFPIYYKILSTVNNNCQGLGQFYVQVNSVPTATLVPDLELCDDVLDGNNTNGTVQGFDLESQTPFILGPNQSAANFTVTYHISATDANTANAALPSPFTNTVANTQEIFVRVTNNATGCFTDHTSFNLIVNPVPIANFVSDLEVCDDNSDGSARNGFSQTIDLESQTATILGTQDPTSYTVSYHRSLADAQNGNIPLSSPYSNLTPNRETIFVRIVNTATGCANNISNFDVLINSEPIFVPVSNLSYCDDDLDGDDTNGIIQNIDLDSQIPSLLGATQDPDDFIVTFHTSKADASIGNAAIASPYTNTNTTETFFVRIQNKATACVNDDASFQVLVNSLPNFYTTSPQIVCLNNTPLTIAAESPAEIYSYQWTDAAGNLISTAQDAAIFVGGSYTVTATTTNGTNCSRSETIVVEESNPAILQQDFVTIVDDGNAIGATDKISISIDTIQNNIGIGDYQFALQNDDTNTTTAFQDAPIFDNLEGGIYTIIVNDKNGCAPDTTLQVSVIQFPKFFTPNADGVNDTWIVKGANKTFYPNTSIHIFNRFGKLVAQIPVDANGWNGTYNGKMLPSDDYWFNITLIPADTNKQIIRKKGHFSLIRR